VCVCVCGRPPSSLVARPRGQEGCKVRTRHNSFLSMKRIVYMLSAPMKFCGGISYDSYARTWGGLSVEREGPKCVPPGHYSFLSIEKNGIGCM